MDEERARRELEQIDALADAPTKRGNRTSLLDPLREILDFPPSRRLCRALLRVIPELQSSSGNTDENKVIRHVHHVLQEAAATRGLDRELGPSLTLDMACDLVKLLRDADLRSGHIPRVVTTMRTLGLAASRSMRFQCDLLDQPRRTDLAIIAADAILKASAEMESSSVAAYRAGLLSARGRNPKTIKLSPKEMLSIFSAPAALAAVGDACESLSLVMAGASTTGLSIAVKDALSARAAALEAAASGGISSWFRRGKTAQEEAAAAASSRAVSFTSDAAVVEESLTTAVRTLGAGMYYKLPSIAKASAEGFDRAVVGLVETVNAFLTRPRSSASRGGGGTIGGSGRVGLSMGSAGGGGGGGGRGGGGVGGVEFGLAGAGSLPTLASTGSSFASAPFASVASTGPSASFASAAGLFSSTLSEVDVRSPLPAWTGAILVAMRDAITGYMIGFMEIQRGLIEEAVAGAVMEILSGLTPFPATTLVTPTPNSDPFTHWATPTMSDVAAAVLRASRNLDVLSDRLRLLLDQHRAAAEFENPFRVPHGGGTSSSAATTTTTTEAFTDRYTPETWVGTNDEEYRVGRRDWLLDLVRPAARLGQSFVKGARMTRLNIPLPGAKLASASGRRAMTGTGSAGGVGGGASGASATGADAILPVLPSVAEASSMAAESLLRAAVGGAGTMATMAPSVIRSALLATEELARDLVREWKSGKLLPDDVAEEADAASSSSSSSSSSSKGPTDDLLLLFLDDFVAPTHDKAVSDPDSRALTRLAMWIECLYAASGCLLQASQTGRRAQVLVAAHCLRDVGRFLDEMPMRLRQSLQEVLFDVLVAVWDALAALGAPLASRDALEGIHLPLPHPRAGDRVLWPSVVEAVLAIAPPSLWSTDTADAAAASGGPMSETESARRLLTGVLTRRFHGLLWALPRFVARDHLGSLLNVMLLRRRLVPEVGPWAVILPAWWARTLAAATTPADTMASPQPTTSLFSGWVARVAASTEAVPDSDPLGLTLPTALAGTLVRMAGSLPTPLPGLGDTATALSLASLAQDVLSHADHALGAAMTHAANEGAAAAAAARFGSGGGVSLAGLGLGLGSGVGGSAPGRGGSGGGSEEGASEVSANAAALAVDTAMGLVAARPIVDATLTTAADPRAEATASIVGAFVHEVSIATKA